MYLQFLMDLILRIPVSVNLRYFLAPSRRNYTVSYEVSILQIEVYSYLITYCHLLSFSYKTKGFRKFIVIEIEKF